jgi:hypothetical protein
MPKPKRNTCKTRSATAGGLWAPRGGFMESASQGSGGAFRLRVLTGMCNRYGPLRRGGKYYSPDSTAPSRITRAGTAYPPLLRWTTEHSVRPSWSASLDAWSAASDHSLCFVFCVVVSFLHLGRRCAARRCGTWHVWKGGEIQRTCYVGQRTRLYTDRQTTDKDLSHCQKTVTV